MEIPSEVLNSHEDLRDWSILTAFRGSIAHGMYVPNSDPNSIDDVDLISVVVPPWNYYLGLKEYGSRGTREIKQLQWDIVIYEARKVVRLLAQGNPNILSLLWTEPEDYLHVTQAGHMLIDYRDLFVGKHVYDSFIGYARAQMHKMTHNAFEGYMGEKRKRLVAQFGYDTKNAAHMIRLLRMGIEFLDTGNLRVKRTGDVETLLAIKRGEWTLEQVQKEAELSFREAEKAYKFSELPDGPDMELVDRLCVDVVRVAGRELHGYT
jgi:uncharacterized protein